MDRDNSWILHDANRAILAGASEAIRRSRKALDDTADMVSRRTLLAQTPSPEAAIQDGDSSADTNPEIRHPAPDVTPPQRES
jgi:hypothetical protein